MSLIELKNYIIKNKRATLPQLATVFKEDRDLIEDMLSILIQKRIICCRALKPACGKACQQCDIANMTLYEMV